MWCYRGPAQPRWATFTRENAMRRFVLILSAVVLSASVLPAAVAKTAEVTSGQCWLKAFKAADADAVTACYAPDAIMWFPGGAMAKGRAAIREGYAGYFKSFIIKDASLAPLGSKTMGNSVARWGTFKVVMTPKAGGADVIEIGRYTDVSEKIAGKWMYVVDHASDDPAPMPAPMPAK